MKTPRLIKKHRKMLGHTQASLAEELGYKNAQIVSNWERNQQGIPSHIVKRLCDILVIDEDKLIRAMLQDQNTKLRARIKWIN